HHRLLLRLNDNVARFYLIAELGHAGGDFAQLAKDNSLDRATAPLGGEIGYVTKDMVTPAFAGAAFSTEPGNFAPLFETEFGWHVLEVTDRRPTEGVRLEEVKEPIEQFLRMREIEAALAALEEEKQVTFYRPEAVQSAPETPPAGSPTN
ncbi:MAG: peptidylprolyl isomerase, partial [Pseudomonadota bacterium]